MFQVSCFKFQKTVDFNVFYKLRDKSLWTEVIFYAFFALLIATIFCYFIFTYKAYLQGQKVGEVNAKLAVYGTQEQKDYERQVFDYKKKIDNFTVLINNHKIASNVFVFIEQSTLPKVWFSGFDMSGSTNQVRLSGESETMEVLSQQFQVFEKNKEYVKEVSFVNSQIEPSGKIKFILTLSLDPKIFAYYRSTY